MGNENVKRDVVPLQINCSTEFEKRKFLEMGQGDGSPVPFFCECVQKQINFINLIKGFEFFSRLFL